jgi:hypothetical protein
MDVEKVRATSNDAFQRTWPLFSSSVVARTNGFGFDQVVLLPQAGHAAEREC